MKELTDYERKTPSSKAQYDSIERHEVGCINGDHRPENSGNHSLDRLEDQRYQYGECIKNRCHNSMDEEVIKRYKMDSIKLVEINILKAFINICETNGLQYYLVGGSALGAIRHHGFIPWDDDIDVGLPRKDYNRFLEIGQAFLPEYYFIQTYMTDPEYPASFAKIRDCRTTFVESSMKNRKINHGVYIDVFPLDYFPEKNVKVFLLRDLLYKARLSTEFSTVASPKMRIIQIVSKVLFPNLMKTLKKRDKHIQSIGKGSKMTNFCGAWRDKELMPSEYFGKGANAQFEGLSVFVPENYDGYLKKLYGDYMTPPPADKRVSHHYTEIIDLEKSYIEYLH